MFLKFSVNTEIEFLSSDYFSLRFPYNASRVANIRRLADRRWNKVERRWEIHVSHLGDVLSIFGLARDTVDKRIVRSFQIHQIRHCRLRLRVDTVSAQFAGTGVPYSAIDEECSFLVPGHQYMPRFVQGKWDGKRHLFNKRSMIFPAGLVPRVRAVLDKEKIAYQVVHEPVQPERQDLPVPGTSEAEAWDRITSILESPFEPARPTFELRDYQAECVQAALDDERGIIELATGAGKTAVAAWIIHKLAQPTLFVVHTRDLLHQTRDYLKENLQMPIGQIGDGRVDIGPVTVATVQTCARALGVKLGSSDDDEPLESDKTDIKSARHEVVAFVRRCSVVFFDECHHLPADSCYSLAMKTENSRWRFGLSATPYRSDRQDMLLEAALGPKLYRVNASLLIEKGFLVPPRIRFLSVPRMRVLSEPPDYQAVFSDYVVENGNRNRLIVENARQLASLKQSSLILVSQVRHGQILHEMMPEAPLIQGADKAEARQSLFRELERKQVLTVIATTLADEGLDIPSLNCVILASGGKSESRALQRLGRALRVAPHKKEATIIDFYDDAPYLKEHSIRRMDLFASEPSFIVETDGIRS